MKDEDFSCTCIGAYFVRTTRDGVSAFIGTFSSTSCASDCEKFCQTRKCKSHRHPPCIHQHTTIRAIVQHPICNAQCSTFNVQLSNVLQARTHGRMLFFFWSHPWVSMVIRRPVSAIGPLLYWWRV